MFFIRGSEWGWADSPSIDALSKESLTKLKWLERVIVNCGSKVSTLLNMKDFMGDSSQFKIDRAWDREPVELWQIQDQRMGFGNQNKRAVPPSSTCVVIVCYGKTCLVVLSLLLYMSVCLCVCLPACLPVNLSFCLTLCVCGCLWIRADLSIRNASFSLSVSFCLSACLSVYPSVSQYVFLSISLPAFQSASL